jgi:hypothetical protein
MVEMPFLRCRGVKGFTNAILLYSGMESPVKHDPTRVSADSQALRPGRRNAAQLEWPEHRWRAEMDDRS